MNILNIGILIGGVIAIAVTLCHSAFYRWFHWKEVFQKVSPLDSKVFYTIHLFLIPIFLLSATLSFFYTDELVRAEGIARGILIFYSLFWLARGLWQIFYFRSLRIEMNDKVLTRMDYIVMTISFCSSAMYFAPIIAKQI